MHTVGIFTRAPFFSLCVQPYHMPYLGTLGQQQRFAKSLDGIVSDPMDAEQQVNISGGELGELKNIARRSSIQTCIVSVIFCWQPIHMLI